MPYRWYAVPNERKGGGSLGRRLVERHAVEHAGRPPSLTSGPRRFVSVAAISGVAYAAKGWVDRAALRRRQDEERDAADRQRRNDALMDVYGDRSSLEALEQAVKFYEDKRRR